MTWADFSNGDARSLNCRAPKHKRRLAQWPFEKRFPTGARPSFQQKRNKNQGWFFSGINQTEENIAVRRVDGLRNCIRRARPQDREPVCAEAEGRGIGLGLDRKSVV